MRPVGRNGRRTTALLHNSHRMKNSESGADVHSLARPIKHSTVMTLYSLVSTSPSVKSLEVASPRPMGARRIFCRGGQTVAWTKARRRQKIVVKLYVAVHEF